jgi:hypothetical protein
MMAGVYGNAIVNIAASHASDGTFGLFAEREGYNLERKYFRTSTGVTCEVYPDHMPERFLEGTALSKRAWAFQERYLAQRTLHFTAEQIFAECHQHIVCETLPKKIPGSSKRPYSFPDRQAAADWSRAVHHYSNGQLTYSKDIFPALSGVARGFQEIFQD